MNKEHGLRFETLAVHAGAEPDPETGAIAPPLHLSTTFRHGPAGERAAGFEYLRESNPTQSRLETACQHGEAAQVDRAGLEAFLRDTSGGYLAVCRHPDPALPPEACVESVAGVMIDATARQMWVAPGVPDTVAFALV